MRGVTVHQRAGHAVLRISTRTPHAGSDRVGRLVLCAGDISTRTPHAGSDAAWQFLQFDTGLFQPALPMRGVTFV